jgi:hypothetical protein
MISFSLIRGVGKPFAIFWNCRPSMRSVASKAVVNSHSPAARLWSTTANPVAIHFQSAVGHHAHKKAWRRTHDVQRNPVKGA